MSNEFPVFIPSGSGGTSIFVVPINGLPITGGTLTGELIIKPSIDGQILKLENSTGSNVLLTVNSTTSEVALPQIISAGSLATDGSGNIIVGSSGGVPNPTPTMTAGNLVVASGINTIQTTDGYGSTVNCTQQLISNGLSSIPTSNNQNVLNIQGIKTGTGGGGFGSQISINSNCPYTAPTYPSGAAYSGNIVFGDYLNGVYPALLPPYDKWGSLGNGSLAWAGMNCYQYNNPSDIRLKEDVTNNELGLNFINQIRTKKYKFKNDEEYSRGIIAQEFEKLIDPKDFKCLTQPQNEEEYYNIDYTKLVTPLIKAVQDLSKIVEEQQRRIQFLEIDSKFQ